MITRATTRKIEKVRRGPPDGDAVEADAGRHVSQLVALASSQAAAGNERWGEGLLDSLFLDSPTRRAGSPQYRLSGPIASNPIQHQSEFGDQPLSALAQIEHSSHLAGTPMLPHGGRVAQLFALSIFPRRGRLSRVWCDGPPKGRSDGTLTGEAIWTDGARAT